MNDKWIIFDCVQWDEKYKMMIVKWWIIVDNTASLPLLDIVSLPLLDTTVSWFSMVWKIYDKDMWQISYHDDVIRWDEM